MDINIAERLELWLPIMFFFCMWMLMQWYGKLPSTDSIQKFVAVINSRGGNIAILAIGAIYFFRYSMYMFLHLLSMVKDKTIAEDNAFALMGIQFVTTSAFGGAMGALLKTMNGESSSARKSDSNGNGNGNGTSQTNASSTLTTSQSTVSSSIPGILPVTNTSSDVVSTTNSSPAGF